MYAKFILFLMFNLIFSINSFASDHRIKTIPYHQNEVITLQGTHLIATGIQFAEGENIISAKVGDALAWMIETSQNTLYVKPVLPRSDTNLLVVTNQRVYQFHLITNPSDTPQSKSVTYFLKFEYPDVKKSALATELESLKADIPDATQHSSQWNYDYSFAGSKEIAPIKAIDNGKFTVFKFKPNSVIPAIFSVDNHQNEQLINFHAQGDYVFIQGIHHQYTLRHGDEVTVVYKDN